MEKRLPWRPASAALALLLWLSFVPSALGGPPIHPPLGTPITGLNQACGTAVDGLGNVYVSSAGESKVKVYDPQYNLLASIEDTHEPCGLAVDSQGTLYVSNQAPGDIEVVKYTPNAFPLSASPTYSGPVTVDASENARGIAVDPVDDRLYVAEGNRVVVFQSDGTTGENEVQSVVVQPSVTGGTFTLEFEGQVTSGIPYLATPAEVQVALEALSTIGAGNISVKEGNVGTRSYLVTFTHALGSKDVPGLVVGSAGLVGGGSAGSGNDPAKHSGFEFNGQIGEGELSGATAVAPYTYRPRSGGERRYLFVATADEVKVLRGQAINALSVKEAIDGSNTPDGSFGFGPAGGALGVDWTNGHLFVYDAEHAALDEFEASGQLLDQTISASFADAEPSGVAVLPGYSEVQELEGIGSARLGYGGAQTAPLAATPTALEVQTALEGLPGIGAGNVSVVRRNPLPLGAFRYLVSFTGDLGHRHVGRITIDRGGRTTTLVEGSGPGRIYLTAGASTGAKLLAFRALPLPGRKALEDLSHALGAATTVATDSHGDVYVPSGEKVRVYRPDGTEIDVTFNDEHEPREIAVDSNGLVYVLDQFGGSVADPPRVTYYTPSAYPPVDGTTYARHEPPVLTGADFGGCGACFPTSMTIDPSNDHLLAVGGGQIKEFESAANGSGFIRDIGPSLGFEDQPVVRVCGATGEIFVGEHAGQISALNAAGTERVAQFDGSGTPPGPLYTNPGMAIDQSNCHVLAFRKAIGTSPPDTEVGREYDARGGFVGSFGSFTAAAGPIPGGIAVDNSGGSSDGNVYVAYEDPSPAQELDVFAFGPPSYGVAPEVKAGAATNLHEGEATLNGTLTPGGTEPEECRFEYLTAAQYEANQEAFLQPFAGAASVDCAESAEEIGEGTDPVPVHADLGGLDLEDRYRFRLLASNEFGEDEDEGLFGAPKADALPALPVLFGEATLRGKVHPWGLATKYRFEYGPDESYGQSTPVAVLPAGDGEVEVSAAITGLEEGQTYHFRLSAENEAAAVSSGDQAFTTQERLGQACEENAEFRTGLSAGLPDCRAYELITPAETNGLVPNAYGMSAQGGNFSPRNWLVVQRGEGAGERVSYFTIGTLPGFDGNGSLDGYRAQRAAGAHPEAGWQSSLSGPTYEQAVPDFTHEPRPEGVSADQLYAFWQITPVTSFAQTLPKGAMLSTPAGFEPVGLGDLGTDLDAWSRHAGPGGAHVIFVSDAQLENEEGNEAPPPGTQAIYDRAAGSTHATVLSLKPDGSPFGAGQNATYLGANEAGTAVVFAVGGALYLHRGGETTEVAPTYTAFAAISEDGARVLYTAEGKLWSFEGGSQTEIEAGATFLAASADATHVFFATEEAGQRQLGVWDGATTSPIAQLAPTDPANLANLAVRSTPDGGAFVFESRAQLTPYENDGEIEVYRYDPSAEPDLICASCDPSGAPPGAGATLITYDGSEVASSTLIQNVTDDGERVLFESPDRLLPRDANDVSDVYEWMASASGGCARELGCLGLISSGQGESASHLYGMSADGHDVFFLSREKLVGADVSGSPSLYDAREGGGIPEAPLLEDCQGDACQGQGSEPPALPAPASTGAGGGNEPPPPPRRPCAKGKHRVKGRCVKRRKHRRHHRAGQSRRAGRR